MQQKTNKPKKGVFNGLLWMYLSIGLILLGIYYFQDNTISKEVNWTEFEKAAESGELEKIIIFAENRQVEGYLSEEGVKNHKIDSTYEGDKILKANIPSADKIQDKVDNWNSKLVSEGKSEINIKYEGYIKKSLKEAEKMLALEEKQIPSDIDYSKIPNLASEARQKLTEISPTTIGQASRISGVNPADISIKEYGIPPKKRYALTINQQNNLMKFVEESQIYNVYLPMLMIMLGTGLRCGELIALTWNDVNMEKKAVTVDHQFIYKKLKDKYQFYESGPKTEAGFRNIPMTNNVYEAFQIKHSIPIITDAEIPYTKTGPATVNIFPPTPITYPSDLYSIAGETIEFAKPVIGIKEPAPANFPILLNILRLVKNAERPIKIIDTTVFDKVISIP